MRKRNIIIISSISIVIVLALAGLYYYQATRFNAHITINNTEVGGLTADQAVKKLKSTVLKNEVYIGQEQIFNGKDTKMGFSNHDLAGIKKILKTQQTFFPSSKANDYSLLPEEANQYRSQTMKKAVEDKLLSMNKGLKAPQDAAARIEQGNLIVTKSVSGQQYDVAGLLKEYEKQEYNSEIHLKTEYLQPIKENDPIIKEEKKKLQELAQSTVHYKVQNIDYPLKGSDCIKNASVTKDMKVVINPEGIKEKVDELNRTKSTLNKNYTFKTHSGSVISVKGQSYGWALDVNAETKRIQDAFEKGQNSILAYNVYGNGWSTTGIGYHVTANNGIGNTYAEVSIEEQKIWIYKDGKLVVTTSVVTGRHDVHEDTPKGVWYVEYKESPSVLKGSEVGNANYSVKVNYWAPFTLGGCGFHDASWRSNWSSTAYLTQGSGGCVNTPPTIMKTVYDNLVQNEPVIVY